MRGCYLNRLKSGETRKMLLALDKVYDEVLLFIFLNMILGLGSPGLQSSL